MTPRGLLAGGIASFVNRLRDAGIAIGIDESTAFARALTLLDAVDLEDIYWAGRTTLVKSEDEIRIFDRIFAFFGENATRRTPPPSGTVTDAEIADDPHASADHTVVVADGPEGHGAEDAGDDRRARVGRKASYSGSLSSRSFDELDAQDIENLQALIDVIARRAPIRPSRRRTAGGRERFDVGATFKDSRRTFGEPVRPRYTTRSSKERPILFVVDVSRSMEPDSHILIRFAYALVRAGRRAEVFAFGTKLTHLTRELRRADPAQLLGHASDAAQDWGGGTRIGASLRELIDTYGRRGLARGAIVVICSDGLDRGDPDELRRQMARLKALARVIVWVNPLAADAGYRPLARGMAAALPYVDRLCGGRTLDELERLLAPLISHPSGYARK